MKTYRLPVKGFINTEIDVQANSKEEAIQLSYKKMNEDTSRFQLNFYYDTWEEDVEEVDVEVADATDVADVPPAPEGITSEGEIYVADLLTNAFIYAPDMQDINIAAEVNKEFGRTEPRKVIETIERLIEFSDEPVEQELETIDAH